MADAAISFAVERLGSLLIEKVGFLGGVEKQVEWVKRELQRMQDFIKDATKKQANDEGIRRWLSEIRELAQVAEDVIETFILEIDNPRRKRGPLERCACFPSHLYHLNKLGKEIKSIRARLAEIETSRQRYKIENIQGSARRPYTAERRRLSPWQRDKHLVGLDEDVKLLLEKEILEETKGLSVASVVGMGGIGKSTLVRVVYNHADVARRFDCRAWVVVSEQFNHTETIKGLVLQLLKPDEDKVKILELIEKSPAEHLNSILYERLKGTEYFIVVDDVWRQQDWELLASAFPDEEVTKSRLLVTSRMKSIPMGARYVHEMRTLDSDRSWELLLKTAFNDCTNIGRCPHELEDIGREIVAKCNGLPLAIMVVGGLLLDKRQSRSGWEKVLQEMNSHLGRSGSSSIQAILELSYHDLPSHLKSCFLCLGFFKEDATILVDKLVHYWIAEGFIPQEGENIMEDTSMVYLDELINRNMVQVKDLSKREGQVKNCQIHDLLRELSIRKAKEEINFEILMDQGNNTPQCLVHKLRHCAIYCSTESYNIFSTKSVNKRIRSLFFHGGEGGNVDFSPSYKWKRFRLLRILEMEGLGLRKLPDTIGELVGLRYLGLKDNRLRELPSSLSRLKNLQVLDISRNKVIVSHVIWKMVSLRHLYTTILYCTVPLEMDSLKNIQTLKNINASEWMLEHLTRMTSLRKLGIMLANDLDVNELYETLATLENLVCLNLEEHSDIYPIQSLDGLVSLRHLTDLRVSGILTKLPCASNFPPNLSSLTLFSADLHQDPMPVLEKLPRLVYLKLDSAYKGEEMVISHKGFPSLKTLHLQNMFILQNIKVGEGGMTELKQLEIYRCENLIRLPEELKFMSNLQELKVSLIPIQASEFRDVNSHIISNIPSVTVDLIR